MYSENALRINFYVGHYRIYDTLANYLKKDELCYVKLGNTTVTEILITLYSSIVVHDNIKKADCILDLIIRFKIYSIHQETIPNYKERYWSQSYSAQIYSGCFIE